MPNRITERTRERIKVISTGNKFYTNLIGLEQTMLAAMQPVTKKVLSSL